MAAFADSGIPKSRFNTQSQYHYRSIDDLMNRLGSLLVRYGLCILPQVLRRECEDRRGESGALLVSVRLLVRFDVVSARDGTRCTIKAWGEALDDSDKGTAKAVSAAYKSAMLQLFCVPVSSDDADATTPRLRQKTHTTEPDQGWPAWAADIIDMIGVCETSEALERVRTRQARLLAALRSERPELYGQIGEAFSSRTQALVARNVNKPAAAAPMAAPASSRKPRRRSQEVAESALEPADG
ncbi:MAG TPA: ERF family protein [Sphingomicrobium sp.]|nr:ERF family protein [Sphingomicrobium sp.]